MSFRGSSQDGQQCHGGNGRRVAGLDPEQQVPKQV
jgi:hypothetical protein